MSCRPLEAAHGSGMFVIEQILLSPNYPRCGRLAPSSCSKCARGPSGVKSGVLHIAVAEVLRFVRRWISDCPILLWREMIRFNGLWMPRRSRCECPSDDHFHYSIGTCHHFQIDVSKSTFCNSAFGTLRTWRSPARHCWRRVALACL